MEYLRISVTDRCNLRCAYCMPAGGIISKPHSEILTFEEMLRLVRICASLGTKKVRLTGGEPLVRKEIAGLIKGLSSIEGLEEICLTTNATLLSGYVEELKSAGLNRINISLDTLREDRFRSITRKGSFYDVMEGIEKAKKAGFYPLKLNTVVMRGVNDDEIADFIDFACLHGLVLRFIEFMKITPLWREDYFIPIEEVMEICEKKFGLESAENTDTGPAVYYKTGKGNVLGFIKTDEKICMECKRLRITSSGELKICLYETEGFSLRNLLRHGACDEEIRDIIKAKREMKEHTAYRNYEPERLYMYAIGG